MAWAVCGLSPVSMTVLIPSSCSSAMAWRLLSFTVSATANSASGPAVEQQHHGLALALQRVELGLQRGEHRPSSSTRRWLPKW
jgi:hypothetical protein